MIGRDTALAVVVFTAGAAALAAEIAAARLLAPSFGSSTVVWANLIGLVLASLAVGYRVGGRLADRHPDPRLLGRLVAAAALLLALVPFAAQPFLDLAVRGVDRYSAGAVIGSFVAVLVLFAPPVALLGMVSPFAVRLGVRDVATAGEVSGRLYALSTLGSLAGTFGAALVAIPAVGTQRTLLGCAAAPGRLRQRSSSAVAGRSRRSRSRRCSRFRRPPCAPRGGCSFRTSRSTSTSASSSRATSASCS